MRLPRLFVVMLSFVLVLAGCEERMEEADATTEAVGAAEALPLTTDSDEAKTHYAAGERALDLGDLDEARTHFEQAVAADPEFAMGYFGLAQSANSFESFKENMERASAKAAGASEAERLRIEQMVKGFENDVDAAIAAATRLTETAPNSPRAWMALAFARSGANDEEGAREAMTKALEIDPDFAPAHMALGFSYTQSQPVDLVRAQTHVERAVELEPDEAFTHDLLGDVYRAQGNLDEAAGEYGRAAELDPGSGNGYQQRGHVHSFLGNWDQARADYDAAIEIEAGKNAAPQFGVYRALVSVHEGNDAAAIDELEALVSAIDGMGVPNPRGAKIFALNTIATIALHAGMLDRAGAALERRNALIDENVEIAGTPDAERNAAATRAIDGGWLAARRGDYGAAEAAAEEARIALEPGNDPARFEDVHELLGYVALQQMNYAEAIAHYEKSDADDIYAMYGHAQALEGAGRADAANELYTKIADWRFNDPDLALVRAEVTKKVGG